ncbi:hypothetical protein QBC32DRAFT_319920 [Pseudoneurospora amorphoporcata]|uniref:Uncharacterized protein n=1 Tax=Pseudoneurospora amorphoporcata TaxID=241081 RepID=A0AAN6SB14_9PEZI|nr:hypothetical protein QBC32DRAFT_319920 [Pseudoneurospora amorphoporcata]
MSNTANPATSKRPVCLKTTVDFLDRLCYQFDLRNNPEDKTALLHFIKSWENLEPWSEDATEETFTDSVVEQLNKLWYDTVAPTGEEFKPLQFGGDKDYIRRIRGEACNIEVAVCNIIGKEPPLEEQFTRTNSQTSARTDPSRSQSFSDEEGQQRESALLGRIVEFFQEHEKTLLLLQQERRQQQQQQQPHSSTQTHTCEHTEVSSGGVCQKCEEEDGGDSDGETVVPEDGRQPPRPFSVEDLARLFQPPSE